MKLFKGIAFLAIVLSAFSLSAQQSNIDAVKQYLLDQETFSEQDVAELVVTDQYGSQHNGVTHVYGSQAIGGVRITNSSFSAVFNKEGELIHVSTNLIQLKGQQIGPSNPSTDANSAILNTIGNDIPGVEITSNLDKLVLSNQNGFSHETEVKLVYFKTPESGIRLAWNFNVDMPAKDHWWDFYIDAQTNEVLQKIDWQVSCTVAGHQHTGACEQITNVEFEELLPPPTIEDGSAYRVYEFPVESPNHGGRTLAIEPAIEAASPFGWHDGDGNPGPDFDITRGNNVNAYEDAADLNEAGNSPDSDGTFVFDYVFNNQDSPEAYQDASITNLFYANNRIHDLLFLYGFDEASGNFQERNYSGLGQNSDGVRAEAQDGSGTNNANMATPTDGNNPRMQMYLWNTGTTNFSVTDVNEPMDLAGTYTTTKSGTFGPGMPEGGLTGDLALAFDGEGNENDLCSEALNPEELIGNIAIFRNGGCISPIKAMFAQDAGAIACVFVNSLNGLGGFNSTLDPDLTIPSIMMTLNEGNDLIAALENGDNVNITFYPDPPEGIRDASFDNGIIIHEYVHGLSNRLTGGPGSAGCLQNDEGRGMGEGWSDWYALMMTMDLSINNPVYRPMGTFADGEPVNGNGIRPAPYDTSFAVNDYTYGDIDNSNIAVPHGVGFIWSTMLWDLTWAFVDEYGFEELETGTTGGNNIAMQLVTDGLKLQPCGPGFIDSRDAILLADQINNDGANQCLIWKVFAKRGLGVSAEQGSADNVNDGEEAFDLPTICQTAIVAPTAAFAASSTYNCDGFVQFTDESFDIPQAWFWEFGDGDTSDEQNPFHFYAGPGLYSVSLTVTNNIGDNITTEINLVEVVEATVPIAEGDNGCEGEEISLSATNAVGGVVWYDSQDNVVGNEEILNITLGANSETYTVYGDVDSPDPVFTGPDTEDFGGGGNHETTFIGTVDFEVMAPMVLASAYVFSGGTGTRTINLYDGLSASGTVIDQVDVDIDFVEGGRIELGFFIETPGEYSIGLNFANLYRNDSGANYPYDGSPFMNIVGSSAGPEFYYYFYDLEAVAPSCLSEGVEVMAEVNGSALFTFESNNLTVMFNSASADALSWDWDFGDGNDSDEENPTHTYATSGVYTASLTTENGCLFETEVDVINTGIESFEEAGISYMPNPARDVLYLQLPTNSSQLQSGTFVDMSGRIVKTFDLSQGGNLDISVGDIANGIYILVLENNFGVPMYQQKISVVH